MRFKNILIAVVLMSCCIGVTSTVAAPPINSPGENFVPNRLLVMPHAGLAQVEFERILNVHGGKISRKLEPLNIYAIDLPPTASEKAVAALLTHNPHIKFAELDMRVPPSFVPNDPYFSSEWHLNKIGAATAWDISLGAGVTIAILDTGVGNAHPDLAAHLVPGWNFYDNNSNTADVHGHGTWVSGAAAAVTNNGVGLSAVAGQANIMPIRIADSAGVGYWSMIAQGIAYAIDHGARIANISYEKLLNSASILSAAQYMKNKGGLVIVAAGNNGLNENLTPSPYLVPVSATDSNDVLTSWSSYGSYVAMSAPGLNVACTNLGGGYGNCWGTSFSSPIVAGTVALMMAAQPTLSNTQIENLLYATAKDLGTSGRDIYYGYGRVDAATAVQAAANTAAPTPDTTSPTVAIINPLNNSTVSGLVSVAVAATDNVGVAKIELRVNGALIGTDTTAPYAFSWDSSNTANGNVNFMATAFDTAGNTQNSATLTVLVANAPDTTSPTVAITKPNANSQIGNKVAISASASDNSGCSGIKLSLYIDAALKSSGTGCNLNYSWNTRRVAVGTHTIEVVAKDAAGNTAVHSINVNK